MTDRFVLDFYTFTMDQRPEATGPGHVLFSLKDARLTANLIDFIDQFCPPYTELTIYLPIVDSVGTTIVATVIEGFRRRQFKLEVIKIEGVK